MKMFKCELQRINVLTHQEQAFEECCFYQRGGVKIISVVLGITPRSMTTFGMRAQSILNQVSCLQPNQ